MDITYGPLRVAPEPFGDRYNDLSLTGANFTVVDADGDGSDEVVLALTSNTFTPGIPEGPAHVALLDWQGGRVVDVTEPFMPNVAYFIVRDFHVADFNGDGIVNALDLGVVRLTFFAPPGPSGLPNLCD